MRQYKRQKLQQAESTNRKSTDRHPNEPHRSSPSQRKAQRLPDDIFWLTAKHYLHDTQDIFSLALTSRNLWGLLKYELYVNAIMESKSLKTRPGISCDISIFHKAFDTYGILDFIDGSFSDEDTKDPLLRKIDHAVSSIDREAKGNIARALGRIHNIEPSIDKETIARWTQYFSRHELMGESGLHWAAARGYTTTVRGFVRAALRIWPEFLDAKSVDGHTAIHLAAKTGNIDIIQLLIDSGVFSSAPSGYGSYQGSPTMHRLLNRVASGTIQSNRCWYFLSTSYPRFGIDALGIAILNRHEEAAVCLLRHFDETFAARWQMVSPIHLAALAGLPRIVERMIVKGHDPNSICLQFRICRPLHMASMREDNTGVIQTLLDNGASLDQVDCRGSGPVHWAVHHNCVANAVYLINAGAYFGRSSWGNIPLKTCMKDDAMLPCTELILSKLSDSSISSEEQDNMLKKSVHRAISCCNRKGIRCNTKTVRTMIQRRIGLGTASSGLDEHDGTSSLHVAARSHCTQDLFELLLEQKPANINGKDNDGFTPLDHAIWNEMPDWKIALLLREGAFPSIHTGLKCRRIRGIFEVSKELKGYCNFEEWENKLRAFDSEASEKIVLE
ncbi:ankyrin repeat-containing domain protein [Whalleya microplaca]|nr:ankyrin repeat-containing domain protein [Whalleya microplaca]